MPVRELKTKSGQGDIVALSSRHDLGVEAGLRAVILWLTHPLSLSLDDVFRPTAAGYLPQRFTTALVTASRTASCRIAHWK